MRHIFLALAWLCGLASLIIAPAVVAQDSALMSLETSQDGRGWEAVGRLDIAGKGFCTAALIDTRIVLTAAHCVYGTDGALLDPDRFLFRAGLRNGRAEVERSVRRFLTHPDYVFAGATARSDTVGNDIAILELDQPIRLTRVQPFAVSGVASRGDAVGIVSYAQDREDAPSLQETCGVLGRQNGMIVMTCEIDYGASGAPVFRVEDGVPRIVSVVSAMAQMNGAQVALGTSLGRPLDELRAAFAALGPARPGGVQRIITAGVRNETGARFVQAPAN